jgi:LacI family transcriptional regulator
MVGYLAERGHQRIGYISGPRDLKVSRVRLAGYNEAVAKFGLSTGPEYITYGEFTLKGGSSAMEILLEQVDVTAVLTANDLMGIGATRHLVASGLRVPEDVSVVGIDDTPMAEFGPVPLTTMRVPTYEIGRQGASLLLQALEHGLPSVVRLSGEIIERESVATIGQST